MALTALVLVWRPSGGGGTGAAGAGRDGGGADGSGGANCAGRVMVMVTSLSLVLTVLAQWQCRYRCRWSGLVLTIPAGWRRDGVSRVVLVLVVVGGGHGAGASGSGEVGGAGSACTGRVVVATAVLAKWGGFCSGCNPLVSRWQLFPP